MLASDATAGGAIGPRVACGPAVPLACLLAPAAAVLPWLLRPSGAAYDHSLHEAVAAELVWAWRQGVAWPPYLHGVNAGLGSFWPSYYPPLFHEAVACGLTAGLGYWASAGVTLLIAKWIGAGLCCGWLRHRVPSGALAVAVVVYSFSPYATLNLYHRGAFPECLAMSWLPGVFWGCDAIRRSRRSGAVAVGVGCFALILLTNLPGAVVGAYATLVYLAATGSPSRDVRSLAWGCVIPLTAAGLTAFFWCPAWFDRGLVTTPASGLGLESPSAHFFRFGQISPRYGFGRLLDLLVTAEWSWWLAFAALAVGPGRPSAPWRGGLALVGAGLWLCSEPSTIAYRHLPLLGTLQFPWRCLAMADSGFVLLMALGVSGPRSTRRASAALLAAWLCLPLAAIWLAAPVRALRDRRAGFPVLWDYRPVSSEAPGPGRPALTEVEVTSGTATALVGRRRPGDLVILTEARTPFVVLVRAYADRRWAAYDQDGRTLKVGRAENDPWARVQVSARAGVRLIRVRLRAGPAAWAGRAISLVTVSVCLLCVTRRARRAAVIRPTAS